METSVYTEKIKAIRKLKHLTQQNTADQLGYHDVKEYSRIETGEKRITLDLLEEIARVFEMTVIGLLAFDEKMVFNQCQQDHSMFGNGNHFHEANAALVAEFKDRIKHQDEEIAFLRRQVEDKREQGH